MAALPKIRVSVKEYLALDRRSQIKYEFVGGEIIAMAGASRRHNLIAFNAGGELRALLKGRPCEGYIGDMRVRIPSTGDYVYPDIVVVCDEPELDPEADLDTLLNPIVIIEVLSPTIADYDQTTKFESYRQIASLREYVLIAQDKAHVIHFRRQPGGNWRRSETRDRTASIELSSIACRLPLAEIYDKVQFDPQALDS